MRRGFTLVLTLVGAVAPGVSAASVIGGPPSHDFPRCSRPLRPCGDPIVIGKGRDAGGRLELVAYRSRVGLCIDFDRRQIGGGVCGASWDASPDSIAATGISHDGRRSHRVTGVFGPVDPAAAEVRARYRKHGKVHHAAAILATVTDPHLLHKLRRDAPFAIFSLGLRGCIPGERIRVAAYDESGDETGHARAAFGGADCGRGGTTVSIGAP